MFKKLISGTIFLAIVCASQTVTAGAPGAADASLSSVGGSTGSGDGNPQIKKINQYALTSTTVIRQLLSDAKAI